MQRIDDRTIECEGVLYTIHKARAGKTCSICSCKACREHGKCYAVACYKMIGGDQYLRRK